MNEDKHRLAIAGLYLVKKRHDPKAGKVVDVTELNEKVELSISVAELYRNKRWRRELRKALAKEGRKVIAINPLKDAREGCDVAVTYEESIPAIARKRKPVTRSGRAIGPPISARTMASKRRGE